MNGAKQKLHHGANKWDQDLFPTLPEGLVVATREVKANNP